MTPRPRSFDEGVALSHAKDLFWTLGYEATSMQNLVDHMGIGRQSLYNTYGDKHHLYLRALELYDKEAHDGGMSVLDRPNVGFAEVRTFLLGVAEALGGQDERRACFLMNALMELGPRDPAVAERGQSFRAKLLANLERALSHAKLLGELREDLDPAATALVLANAAMGLSVTWKAGASAAELIEIAETSLAAVAPPVEPIPTV